jgi:hypothetical protein
MTQPSYAPITEAAKVRPAYSLQTPIRRRARRVAELSSPEPRVGPGLGVPGPDQGYALLVAEELFSEQLQLSPGVGAEDALRGCSAVACARAARIGRAPTGKDVEFALVLFGFLDDAPADLIEWRTPLFQAAAHDYLAQRQIVDSVPTETLRLAPDEVRACLADWRSLVLTTFPPTPVA